VKGRATSGSPCKIRRHPVAWERHAFDRKSVEDLPPEGIPEFREICVRLCPEFRKTSVCVGNSLKYVPV
jgi:hypothetical protein